MRVLPIVACVVLWTSAACSGNPMPGDSDYPYNLTGEYDVSIDAMGSEYAGPAKLTTSPGGLVYGVLDLQGPERVAGNLEGEISGDTLTFNSNYERGGGCTGVLSGEGRITEGGASVAGVSVIDDDCTGDLFDAAFKFTRKTTE
jgi:hypothetical protein